ncbi:MAG: hypothetical protein OXC93_05620 [Rhodospirillaceae bacterium]|nr:hypothetical protein [Rhodospirillaceae bacterium]
MRGARLFRKRGGDYAFAILGDTAQGGETTRRTTISIPVNTNAVGGSR